jgi:hypothetical protein
MYRIDGATYYGKYIGYMSDKYEEGLDVELLTDCYPILRHAYGLSNDTEISFGVISYQRSDTDYFSEHEKDMFDLLYCKWSNQPVDIFVKGKRIERVLCKSLVE